MSLGFDEMSHTTSWQVNTWGRSFLFGSVGRERLQLVLMRGIAGFQAVTQIFLDGKLEHRVSLGYLRSLGTKATYACFFPMA